VSDSRAANSGCVQCHEPRGVLAAWGVKSNFVELTQVGPPYMAITCTVCHDPHDARNPKQLRFAVDVPSLELNLCMRCHYRRAVPDFSNSSPHSPQGPVLIGDAGWVPPNFEYPAKSLVGSHGSDRNPKLCATCHVNRYEITDKLTGKFVFRATGHTFQAIPCVDAQGIPLPSQTDCLEEDPRRSFGACVTCHLSETAARSARSVARARLSRLADEVDSLYVRIPASEKVANDTKITTAEGARFNAQLARQPGTPIHNPFLAEALLLASIRQIGIDYGLTSISTGLSLRPQLAAPPTLKGKVTN
jgi:predicted CXXCH cytochrome family protein